MDDCRACCGPHTEYRIRLCAEHRRKGTYYYYPTENFPYVELLGSKYVYSLRDPDTHAVRYVGVSTYPPTRLQRHIADAKKAEEPTAKDSWILSCQPVIEILEYVGLGGHNCYAAERWWIQEMRRRGEPLLSRADRGKAVV